MIIQTPTKIEHSKKRVILEAVDMERNEEHVASKRMRIDKGENVINLEQEEHSINQG